MKYILLLLLSTAFCFSSLNAQERRAQRALQNMKEGDIERAIDLLRKATSDDPGNPAVIYVWSKLMENSSYPKSDLDSAYFFILQARENFQFLSVKEREKLNKNGFDSLLFQSQKQKLDSLNFLRAKNQHSVDAYTFYLSQHTDALEYDSAVYLRQAVAFKNASEIHSPEAYKTYMESYPSSPFLQEANKRYEGLVYSEVSQTGTLAGLLKYIENKPNSDFRANVEQQIFDLMLIGNRESDYQRFLKLASTSKGKHLATDFYYHTLRESDSVDWESQTWLTDSLKTELQTDRQTLVPVYSKEGYNLINEDGELILEENLEDLPNSYLCEPIETDVLLFPNDSTSIVAQRNGRPIFYGNAEEIQDIGFGFVRISNSENRIGIIHKSGRQILPFIYDHASVLKGKYLLVEKEKRKGLYSLTGNQLLTIGYDSIYMLHETVLVKTGNRLAIISNEELRKNAEGKEKRLSFIYDEAEAWENTKIWVRAGEKEGLLNEDTGFAIPLEKQLIESMPKGFLIEKDGIVNYLDTKLNTVLERCSAIQSNSSFLTALSNDKIFLINTLNDQIAVYDSVKLWGEHFAVTQKGDQLFLIAENNQKISLNSDEQLRLISNETSTNYIVISDKDSKKVYNNQGEIILSGDFQQVNALGSDLISFEKGKKKGLINNKGKELLPNEYDAIAQHKDGGLTLLKKGLLGYYNPKDSLLVKTQFKKPLSRGIKGSFLAYDEEGWFVFTPGKKQDLDAQPRYSKLYVWNDSSYLGLKNGKYEILGISGSKKSFDHFIEIVDIESSREKEYLLFKTATGTGVISRNSGIIIEPEFTFILEREKFFIAERYFSSGEIYSLFYFDPLGHLLWNGNLNRSDYDKLYCDK